MNTKVSFGFDFLNIMAHANLRSGNENIMNGYNLARLFLMTEWGLTAEEQDSANELFLQAMNKNTFEDLGVVVDRFLSHLKNDVGAKTEFVIEMITINFLDGNITDAEKEFTLAFASDLDFRKSEIDEMVAKAFGFATAYAWFGENFTKQPS